jgi:hypothetical protein
MAGFTLHEIRELEELLIIHDLPINTIANGDQENIKRLCLILETEIAMAKSIGARDVDEQAIILQQALRKLKDE